MKRASAETLAQGVKSIDDWSHSLGLDLIDLILGEAKPVFPKISHELMNEALPEANHGQLLKEGLELIDGLVFFLSELNKLGVSLDYQALASHPIALNGHGSSSAFYEKLEEAIGNFPVDRNYEADALHILSLFLSRIYLVSPHSFLEMVNLVLDKNKANRPKKNQFGQEYYGSSFQTKSLTEAGVVEKYQHTEKCLGILRDHFGSPLESWMHQLTTGLILDYSSSQENIGMIKRVVKEVDLFLVDLLMAGRLEVGQEIQVKARQIAGFAEYWQQNLGMKLSVTPRMIDHALLAAGAKEVKSSS